MAIDLEDKKKLHTWEEITKIGKRDVERFVAICNYYLEKDYERFQAFIKPKLIEMLNSVSL